MARRSRSRPRSRDRHGLGTSSGRGGRSPMASVTESVRVTDVDPIKPGTSRRSRRCSPQPGRRESPPSRGRAESTWSRGPVHATTLIDPRSFAAVARATLPFRNHHAPLGRGEMNEYPVKFAVDYPERELNRLTSVLPDLHRHPDRDRAQRDHRLFEHLRRRRRHDGDGRRSAASGPVLLPVLLMILFREKYPRWWFDWNLAAAALRRTGSASTRC